MFRVWDKSYNKMRKVDSIAFDKKDNIKVVNVWGYCIIDQKDIIISFNSPEKLKRIILMQSTGLKDVNGKEIFEGDVVNNGGLAIVKFGRFVDTKMHEQLGFYVEYIDDDLLWNGSINGNIDMLLDCEVVGNIHDNPELLEVELWKDINSLEVNRT